MSKAPPQVWPVLSKSDAARVLELVNPKPIHHDHCLREAEESVQWIKRKTAAIQSPGQRRKTLIRAAKKIEAAIKSIEGLREATQREIDPKALRRTIKLTEVGEVETQPGTLHQLRDRIVALAEKITVPRSGGKKTGPGGGRIEAAQKRAAADCAKSMIKTCGSKRVAFVPYCELTALLFELATDGKIGDVEQVCRARWRAGAR
jgi:hypothetical protein